MIKLNNSFFIILAILSSALTAQEKKFIHYTNEAGLPYSAITDFIQDNQGFMWIGMRTSVCRFDGYEFIEYTPLDTAGNKVNLHIPTLSCPGNNDLFIKTTDSRLFKYSESFDLFQEINLPGIVKGFRDIIEYRDSCFWILADGRLALMNTKNYSVRLLKEVYPEWHNSINNQPIAAITGFNDKLIVLTEKNQILILNPENMSMDEISVKLSSTDNVSLFTADKFGMIWLNDTEKGLTRISPKNHQRIFFSDTCTGSSRILHNIVRSVIYDHEGNVWIGTENGLSVWSQLNNTMVHYQENLTNPDGLNSNAIYDIYPDKEGNMWIGTYFGGINLWYAGKEFFSIRTAGFGPYDLGGKEVSCITEDPDGNIWVGLEGKGINRIDRNTGIVKKYTHTNKNNSLSYNNVHALLWGKNNKLYIGTYTGGLNVLDPETGKFSVINTSGANKLPSDNIYSLFAWNDSILIGTDNGIVALHLETGELYPFHDEIFRNQIVESFCLCDGEVWISKRSVIYRWDPVSDTLKKADCLNNIKSISFVTTDSKNNIWAGDSYKGLFFYDQKKDTVCNFSPGNFFPFSRIFGLIEGISGWYWVSTTGGLVRFNPYTRAAITYNTESGLPFNQFNFNAFYKSGDNRLYFGGINGLVSFDSRGCYQWPGIENIAFSRVEIFNKNIKPGNRTGMTQIINKSRKITLTAKDKYFTVYFSALNFTHPGRIQYKYKLEGFNSKWIHSGNRNSATYTNLSPGKYRLHIKASVDNVNWSTRESVLSIQVKPPFILSPFAYIIYGIILVGGLGLFLLTSLKIQKSKALAIIERNERNQEKKLNQAKLEFFTNVSHELKTPLTLIIGPLTNVINSEKISDCVKTKLNNINDNARRLLSLINQLMEFRKTDLGKAELRVSEGDINLFSREIKEAFDNIAEVRSITFSLSNSTPFKPVYFDHKKLERILFNLLSNAFKYTEDGGKISLDISLKNSPDSGFCGDYLLFEIKDNGCGIPEEVQDKIFERFYRSSNNQPTTGSGIGLALVKNHVELHKGRIELESKPGKGSLFRFVIPCQQEDYTSAELTNEETHYILNTNEIINLELIQANQDSTYHNKEDNPLILIVEDNSEMLSFLSEFISEKFSVMTSNTGEQALELIEKRIPDVIISDIIMPGMDGIQLTKRIKTCFKTSHIPVILLTAKTEVEDKYEGYLSGADSYIEKPFYPHLLLKHIENVLSTRKKLVDTFRNNIDSRPEEIAHSKSDKEFIEKLSSLIIDNIDNPDLDVSFLVKNMNVSRSLLHLKLKKIAGCSTTVYIRTLRLRKAAKLITDEGINFSEAAYQTGFSSPAFFSQRFKEYFGMTPSQFVDKLKHKANR